MKQAAVFAAVAMLTGVASYFLTYGIMLASPQENASRTYKTVYQVCEMSRHHINGDLEEACGAAQDVSDTTFTCTDGICTVQEKYK